MPQLQSHSRQGNKPDDDSSKPDAGSRVDDVLASARNLAGYICNNQETLASDNDLLAKVIHDGYEIISDATAHILQAPDPSIEGKAQMLKSVISKMIQLMQFLHADERPLWKRLVDNYEVNGDAADRVFLEELKTLTREPEEKTELATEPVLKTEPLDHTTAPEEYSFTPETLEMAISLDDDDWYSVDMVLSEINVSGIQTDPQTILSIGSRMGFNMTDRIIKLTALFAQSHSGDYADAVQAFKLKLAEYKDELQSRHADELGAQYFQQTAVKYTLSLLLRSKQRLDRNIVAAKEHVSWSLLSSVLRSAKDNAEPYNREAELMYGLCSAVRTRRLLNSMHSIAKLSGQSHNTAINLVTQKISDAGHHIISKVEQAHDSARYRQRKYSNKLLLFILDRTKSKVPDAFETEKTREFCQNKLQIPYYGELWLQSAKLQESQINNAQNLHQRQTTEKEHDSRKRQVRAFITSGVLQQKAELFLSYQHASQIRMCILTLHKVYEMYRLASNHRFRSSFLELADAIHLEQTAKTLYAGLLVRRMRQFLLGLSLFSRGTTLLSSRRSNLLFHNLLLLRKQSGLLERAKQYSGTTSNSNAARLLTPAYNEAKLRKCIFNQFEQQIKKQRLVRLFNQVLAPLPAQTMVRASKENEVALSTWCLKFVSTSLEQKIMAALVNATKNVALQLSQARYLGIVGEGIEFVLNDVQQLDSLAFKHNAEKQQRGLALFFATFETVSAFKELSDLSSQQLRTDVVEEWLIPELENVKEYEKTIVRSAAVVEKSRNKSELRQVLQALGRLFSMTNRIPTEPVMSIVPELLDFWLELARQKPVFQTPMTVRTRPNDFWQTLSQQRDRLSQDDSPLKNRSRLRQTGSIPFPALQ